MYDIRVMTKLRLKRRLRGGKNGSLWLPMWHGPSYYICGMNSNSIVFLWWWWWWWWWWGGGGGGGGGVTYYFINSVVQLKPHTIITWCLRQDMLIIPWIYWHDCQFPGNQCPQVVNSHDKEHGRQHDLLFNLNFEGIYTEKKTWDRIFISIITCRVTQCCISPHWWWTVYICEVCVYI